MKVGPQPALADQKLSIRLGGLKPNEIVSLTADSKDNLGRPWQSYATFKANAQGLVDLDTDKPLAGTYNLADSMGLFWSMRLMNSGSSGDLNYLDDENPEGTSTGLTAKVDGQQIATLYVRRLVAADGVTRTTVNQDGLAGVFYTPGGGGRHPAVIILAGAEGGLHSDQAALLASHGFASLALAYFNFPGLPNSLRNIPLEYFETAIHWLQNQPGVMADRVAVIGASRGGELALVLGATFPEIKAVIAYVPSSHLGPGEDSTVPAWILGGNPLPFVADFDTIFEAARGDTQAVQKASLGVIHVEKIWGPVLLISAKDDRLWPSFLMSNEIMQRLDDYHHPYPDKHLSYDAAGHLILEMIPFLPYTAQRDPVNVIRYINYYGGTTAADALAEEDSWPQVLDFLREFLK